MFKIGKVVLYNNSICTIKDIKKSSINHKDYYVLVPVTDESLIINIPVENNSIENIMTKEEARELIKKIPLIKPLETDINDRNIELQYRNLLLTHDKDNLIKIIKTSYLRNKKRINNNKKISTKDDTYLKKAEELLYRELSYSLNMPFDDVFEYIKNYCSSMQ